MLYPFNSRTQGGSCSLEFCLANWFALDEIKYYKYASIGSGLKNLLRTRSGSNAMTMLWRENSHNLRRIHHSSSNFSLAAGSARVQVNLLVDPVLHGWIKTLRMPNYLLALATQKTKTQISSNPG